MTTFYAAAKYPLAASQADQWDALSDLTVVAFELVRLALALDESLEKVLAVFEEAMAQAEYEWEECEARDA